MFSFLNPIFIYLLISVCFNLIIFIPAYFLKTDKLTDISYSLTFIFLASLSFWTKFDRNIWDTLLFLMIVIWAFRLGAYLFFRINKTGKDKRFDGIRENFFKFMFFWFAQGVSVWFVMIPALMFFMADNFNITPIFLMVAGILIWLEGIVIETISDYQKYKFIEENKDKERKWVNRGLWKYSRHPNYFGEIELWFGVYLYSISRLGFYESLIALIGPVYIYLVIRYFSGIRILENKDDARYGDNPEYLEYKKNTGLLFPKLIKHGKSK